MDVTPSSLLPEDRWTLLHSTKSMLKTVRNVIRLYIRCRHKVPDALTRPIVKPPPDSPNLKLYATNEEFEQRIHHVCNAPTLMFPDFSRLFILYVDGSLETGFGAAIHQMDITLDPPVERPILYISKIFSPAERRYWPIELKTAALVWALGKVQQYVDHGNFTVVIDH